MPTFSEALDRFKEDGFFGLDTTELYTEQIERLQIMRAQNRTQDQTSEETALSAAQERSGTNPSFFARR